MPNFSELFPALVNCFAIILFGYISGRVNIITPKQGQGIGQFVGTFALPALLFKAMVELDFHTVSWGFMVAVLLAKLTVFLIVLTFSLILVKPRTIGRGALYAIFATQSNDFAVGYPLVQALYSKSHPEFLQYIYLAAPISFLILNPIGFILLEIDKHRNPEESYMVLEDDEENGTELDVIDEDLIENNTDQDKVTNDDTFEEQNHFTGRSCLNVIKGVVLNPMVFMVFIGLAGNFIFHGHLPNVIGQTLQTLGNAFSGAALFYLGLTMVGKISQQKGSGLVVPAALIVAKIVVLPILIRELVLAFRYVLPVNDPGGFAQNSTNATDYLYTLADFGYLYGTFPTAPTVVIYAAKYGIEMDRLATGMVFCTSLSAPIMYVSAWTLTMTRMSNEYFIKELHVVDKDISIIALFCSTWCIIIFIIGRKYLRVPHIITLAYLFSLIFSSLGTILWNSYSIKSSQPILEFLFGMLIFGVTSSRLFTASMAVALVMVLSRGQRWLWINSTWFILAPLMGSLLTTSVLMSSCEMNITEPRAVFAYGRGQNVTSFVILVISFSITTTSLIIMLRVHGYQDTDDRDKRDQEDESSALLSPNTNSDVSSIDEDVDSAIEDEQNCCFFRTECWIRDIQKVRHIILLLLLSLSMFVGLCLITWRLTENAESGLYFEIAFLDSVLDFGQGFIAFCVFGLDSELIIDPFVRFYRKIRYGSEDINLQELNEVDKETLHQCLQFVNYHLDDCKIEIVGSKRSLLNTYEDVFTGRDFCTWLVDRGLVNDRAEALIYGGNLLLGRVIYNHKKKHYFHDHKYFYKFEESKTCYRKIKSPARRIDEASSTGSISSNRPINLLVGSPFRSSYQGYSFEAYLTNHDSQSFSRSLNLRSDFGNRNASANNKSNCASTSETASQPNLRKFQSFKKIQPELHKEWSHSDTSS